MGLQKMKEPYEGKSVCASIEQQDFISAQHIAKKYTFEQCQETFEFKVRAADGALSLGHKDLVEDLTRQMEMITEAIDITIEKGRGDHA